MKNSVVVDAQSHAVRVCELDQRFAFAASKGERLFDEDMQPGRQRFSGDFEMVRRRNQDMDYLRPAAAEELGDRPFDARRRHLRRGDVRNPRGVGAARRRGGLRRCARKCASAQRPAPFLTGTR